MYAYETKLLEAVHQWCEALNHQSSTHVVFLDFAKAFDSVPYRRLCLKLDNIGIRGPLPKVDRSVSNRQTSTSNGRRELLEATGMP